MQQMRRSVQDRQAFVMHLVRYMRRYVQPEAKMKRRKHPDDRLQFVGVVSDKNPHKYDLIHGMILGIFLCLFVYILTLGMNHAPEITAICAGVILG